jgi:hypothetical protein
MKKTLVICMLVSCLLAQGCVFIVATDKDDKLDMFGGEELEEREQALHEWERGLEEREKELDRWAHELEKREEDHDEDDDK